MYDLIQIEKLMERLARVDELIMLCQARFKTKKDPEPAIQNGATQKEIVSNIGIKH